jgi:hypothetical protein
MLERNSADLDVHSTLVRAAGLHPREVVHALGEAVLAPPEESSHDDATVVCLGLIRRAIAGPESDSGSSSPHTSP